MFVKRPPSRTGLQKGDHIGVLPTKPGPDPATQAATAGQNQSGPAAKQDTALGSAEQPTSVRSLHQPPESVDWDVTNMAYKAAAVPTPTLPAQPTPQAAVSAYAAGGQLDDTKSHKRWAVDERESVSDYAWMNCAGLYLVVIIIVGSLMVAYMLRQRFATPIGDNSTVSPQFVEESTPDKEDVVDRAADEDASSTSEQRDVDTVSAQTFAQSNPPASTDVADAWTSQGTDTNPLTEQE